MNTTIDLKTAKTIEAMNQKINHMDNAVTDFFNKRAMCWSGSSAMMKFTPL